MRGATAAVSAACLLSVGGAVLAVWAATRLDRLHVRTDAAWAALDDALNRRALAVSAELSGLAELALRAAPGGREDAENELGRALLVLDRATLDPARMAQLAETEQRVVIARRVYNDAVRDTLALRSHRLVRWLRLAGTAPLPRYFEIAEPVLPGDAPLPDDGPVQDDGAGA